MKVKKLRLLYPARPCWPLWTLYLAMLLFLGVAFLQPPSNLLAAEPGKGTPSAAAAAPIGTGAAGGNQPAAKNEKSKEPNMAPVNTVKEIQKAIDNSNLDAFMRRVDLDSLTYQATDMFLQRLPDISDKMSEKGMLPPMLILATSALKKGPDSLEYQTARVFIATAAKQFVKDGVESGAFAGKKNIQENGLPESLFAGVSKGRKEVIYPRLESEKRDKSLVGAMFKDYGSGDVFLLLLEARETPDGWKIKRIENLEEIFKSLEKQLGLR